MKKHNQYLFFVSLLVVGVNHAASSSEDDYDISLVPQQEVRYIWPSELKQRIHQESFEGAELAPVPNTAGQMTRTTDLMKREFDLRVRSERVSSSRSTDSDGLEWLESDGGSSIAIHTSEVPGVSRDKSEDGLDVLLNTRPSIKQLAALREQFPAQRELLKGANTSSHKVGIDVKG